MKKEATLSEQVTRLGYGIPANLCSAGSAGSHLFWTDEPATSQQNPVVEINANLVLLQGASSVIVNKTSLSPFAGIFYDTQVETFDVDPLASFQGITSVNLSSNVESHGSPYANLIYGHYAPTAPAIETNYVQWERAGQRLVMHHQAAPVIETSFVQLERAIRRLRILYQQWEQISTLSKETGDHKFADFDPRTLQTSRQLIQTLSPYLVGSETENESVFLVPAEDGSVLLKWVRKDKELSITVDQNLLLQVQRWTPLDSYESEGYWEITPAQVRDHFDWMTR